MSDIAIRVENLSKRYRIGLSKVGGARSLRQALTSPFRYLASTLRLPAEAETLWALNDVSFEVKQGEVMGIIGHNGAGKSTLLKILSRITQPTSGRAVLNGRVGSLLEVGTGFHPELTGRENIYLNGAILGMRRAEIARRFDEIVEFSGVEKFLDTPVKRYSSGMYVRLAFSVAAHLDTEIMLVDEVLAVGDANFQKRCLGKISNISSHGRTVVIISHILPMIARLCERAILLEKGKIIADNTTSVVINCYQNDGINNSSSKRTWPSFVNAPGDATAKLNSVSVKNKAGEIVQTIDISEPVYLEVEYWNLTTELKPCAIIQVFNEESISVFASVDFVNREWWSIPREVGIVRAICKIPGDFLPEGQFYVFVAIGSYNPNMIHAKEDNAISFQIIDRSEGSSSRGDYVGFKWPGVVRPKLDWEIYFTPSSGDFDQLN